MNPVPNMPPFPVIADLTNSHGETGNSVDIDALIKVINQQEGVIEKKSTVIADQKKRIALLEEYLRLERARLYGRSSEKSDMQGEMFNEIEQADDGSGDAAEDEPTHPRSPKKPSGRGRQPLSPSLPRFQERVELTDEEKEGAIDTFFTKVREELDIIPAKVRVKEILQEKAAGKTHETMRYHWDCRKFEYVSEQ